MQLYTIMPYKYYVAPVIQEIHEDDMTVRVATWKYDHDQKYFNFEIQFPLSGVKDDFHWETGSFFLADMGDMIEDLSAVMLKDDLLILHGLKGKGNS